MQLVVNVALPVPLKTLEFDQFSVMKALWTWRPSHTVKEALVSVVLGGTEVPAGFLPPLLPVQRREVYPCPWEETAL